MEFDNIEQKILDIAVPNDKVNEAIIYALIKDGEIIYIGQTTRGLVRILAHVKNKDFDSYATMDMGFFGIDEDFYWSDVIEIYEEELIVRLNPKLNRSIKGYMFMSLSQIQKAYEMTYWSVTKMINASDIKRYIFNSNVYYYFDDVDKLVADHRYGSGKEDNDEA
jgi:hypothetical protein